MGALVAFFGTDDVNEFGAGKGCYTDALRIAGVNVHGFEGARNISKLTDGFIRHADLTTELSLERRDWVMSFEVAEHVPKEHEATMLSNFDRHNRKGIVLSWGHSRAGVGHVNPRSLSYVRAVLGAMNYTEDVDAGKALRTAVSTWHWFRMQVTHGTPGGGVYVWRRKQPNGTDV